MILLYTQLLKYLCRKGNFVNLFDAPITLSCVKYLFDAPITLSCVKTKKIAWKNLNISIFHF